MSATKMAGRSHGSKPGVRGRPKRASQVGKKSPAKSARSTKEEALCRSYIQGKTMDLYPNTMAGNDGNKKVAVCYVDDGKESIHNRLYIGKTVIGCDSKMYVADIREPLEPLPLEFIDSDSTNNNCNDENGRDKNIGKDLDWDDDELDIEADIQLEDNSHSHEDCVSGVGNRLVPLLSQPAKSCRNIGEGFVCLSVTSQMDSSFSTALYPEGVSEQSTHKADQVTLCPADGTDITTQSSYDRADAVAYRNISMPTLSHKIEMEDLILRLSDTDSDSDPIDIYTDNQFCKDDNVLPTNRLSDEASHSVQLDKDSVCSENSCQDIKSSDKRPSDHVFNSKESHKSDKLCQESVSLQECCIGMLQQKSHCSGDFQEQIVGREEMDCTGNLVTSSSDTPLVQFTDGGGKIETKVEYKDGLVVRSDNGTELEGMYRAEIPETLSVQTPSSGDLLLEDDDLWPTLHIAQSLCSIQGLVVNNIKVLDIVQGCNTSETYSSNKSETMSCEEGGEVDKQEENNRDNNNNNNNNISIERGVVHTPSVHRKLYELSPSNNVRLGCSGLDLEEEGIWEDGSIEFKERQPLIQGLLSTAYTPTKSDKSTVNDGEIESKADNMDCNEGSAWENDGTVECKELGHLGDKETPQEGLLGDGNVWQTLPETTCTPKKIIVSTNIDRLKMVGRELGCYTPKTKFKKWGRKEHKSWSMTFHVWAAVMAFPLNAKDCDAEILTEKHVEEICEFGGPNGLNLLPAGLNSKQVYMRHINGFKKQDGTEISFVGSDHKHWYPTNCPFLHCLYVKEWLKINNISCTSSESLKRCTVSPKSPTELKKLVKKYQESEVILRRSLQVEEQKNQILIGKVIASPVDQQIKCPVCGKDNFSRRDALKRHVDTFHENYTLDADYAKEKVKCKYCNKVLAKRSLKVHLLVCKKEKSTFTNELQVTNTIYGKCDECGVPQSKLRRHKILCHGYSDCAYCKKNLGKPCSMCCQTVCSACCTFPEVCPKCEIRVEMNAKESESLMSENESIPENLQGNKPSTFQSRTREVIVNYGGGDREGNRSSPLQSQPGDGTVNLKGYDSGEGNRSVHLHSQSGEVTESVWGHDSGVGNNPATFHYFQDSDREGNISSPLYSPLTEGTVNLGEYDSGEGNRPAPLHSQPGDGTDELEGYDRESVKSSSLYSPPGEGTVNLGGEGNKPAPLHSQPGDGTVNFDGYDSGEGNRSAHLHSQQGEVTERLWGHDSGVGNNFTGSDREHNRSSPLFSPLREGTPLHSKPSKATVNLGRTPQVHILGNSITDQDEIINMEELMSMNHVLTDEIEAKLEEMKKELKDEAMLIEMIYKYDRQYYQEGLKKKKTAANHINNLKIFFSWLKERYSGVRLAHLIDFREELEKPQFPEREGYQSRRPNGPFLITESDVRQCIEENFNNLGSPANSKRNMFYALMFLFKFLRMTATTGRLSILDEKGSDYFSNHYQLANLNLRQLGSTLKAKVAMEKREKDDLAHEEEAVKRLKIKNGLVEWGNNEDRLQWHQEVSDEYDQHCADPSYVCSADFITKASQFGPAEIAIHTPYRAGVAHLIPWKALVKAKDCFEPTEHGELDDIEEMDEGDGVMVTVRKDWFRPPVSKRCPCQQEEIPKPCVCGRGEEPQGVCTRLYWDKCNNENRYFFIYYKIFETLSKLMPIRDRFLSTNFPNGPNKSEIYLEDGWYKGETPFFVNRQGSPVNKVHLDLLSGVIGVHVKCGDLRRQFTTDLAHNRKQVIRDSEARIAGHSHEVFNEYYDVESQQTTQTLITSLQEGRDTIGPLVSLALPTRPSLGNERRERMEDLRRQDEILRKRKLTIKKELSDPVTCELARTFARNIININHNWIDKRKSMTALSWKKLTFKMMCSKSVNGKLLRDAFGEIFNIGREKLVSYVLQKCIRKEKRKQALVNKDKDCILQIIEWFHGVDFNLEQYKTEERSLEDNVTSKFKLELEKNIHLPPYENKMDINKLSSLMAAVYTKSELDDLIDQAQKLSDDEWFIMILADEEKVLFNINNINVNKLGYYKVGIVKSN